MQDILAFADFGFAGLMAAALIVSNWKLLQHFDRAISQLRQDHRADMTRIVGMMSARLSDHAKAVDNVAAELRELQRSLRE